MNPAGLVTAALNDAGYPHDVIDDPVAGRVAQFRRRPPRVVLERAHQVVGWPASFDDDFDHTPDALQLALDDPTPEQWADFVARDGGRPVPIHLDPPTEGAA